MQGASAEGKLEGISFPMNRNCSADQKTKFWSNSIYSLIFEIIFPKIVIFGIIAFKTIDLKIIVLKIFN